MLKRKPPGRQFDAFPPEVFDAIADRYGLGGIRAVQSVVVEGDRIVLLGEKSETSRKYLIETPAGRYFLKEVPWYCDEPGKIEFAVALGNHLADGGHPLARALRCADGAAYASVAGSSFVLFEYRPGRLFDGSQAHRAAAGRGLARMHDGMARFSARPAAADSESVRTVVDQHLRLAAQVRPAQAGAGTGFDALGRDLLAQLPDEVGDHPVHGDFIPWNVAYDAHGDLCAVYDLDNAAYGSPLRDLGKALSSFHLLPYTGFTTVLHALPPAPPDAFPDMAPLLDAYLEERPLPAGELERLPDYLVGGFAASVLLSLVRGEQPDATPAVLSTWLAAVRAAGERLLP
ncbi:MAG: phosphotransferase [Streptomyces sp.]|nr:phosphotransferase [Streptomyces sp.]